MPRKRRLQEVDLDSCRVYHVVSKCVRSLRLLEADADGKYTCKLLCVRELERVAETMAIEVAGFAVMENHLHLQRWSPNLGQPVKVDRPRDLKGPSDDQTT